VLSTPPAFILSQDQTLHLNLFHRPGPKSEPVEEESEPAFTKTGNSAFFKKQEKDVWHALLSFQGTAPPGLWSPKAAPFHRRDIRKSALRRSFQLIRLPSVQSNG
jgi:hypothetical protein